MSVINLGCVSNCETVDLGVTATQAGAHRFKTVFNGVSMSWEVTYSIGDPITIDVAARPLNEMYGYVIDIVQPDGVLLADSYALSVNWEA